MGDATVEHGEIIMSTRRNFIAGSAAAAGAIAVMPSLAFAVANGRSFNILDGKAILHPVAHASFVIEAPTGVIYVDCVGEPAQYANLPDPDLILISHRHGDHLSTDLLETLPAAPILTNGDVFRELPDDLKERAAAISVGESKEMGGAGIEAVPSYNITPGRENFHPMDRGDIGFVLTLDGSRMYISGDTEATPEMRALQNIDLALVCMNLPFTMTAAQAADGVAEFAPKMVIPYHYRGRDDGTQDPQEFARLLTEAGASTEVKLHDWYNGTLN